MDPIFASVLLGFFSLVIALVAIAIAIAYRQNDVASEAIKNSNRLYQSKFPKPDNSDIQNDSSQ